MKEFTTKSVKIVTQGGYTYEQVMNNKNVSKNPKYWYQIEGTDKYLFKSRVAESWEFFDPQIENPIRNTNQIYIRFLDVSSFVEPSNYFRRYKTYTRYIEGTIGYEKFWDDLEDKIEDGFETDGVRITGRHFFAINFARFRVIPVDEKGYATSDKKKWEFLRFLDHQYYLFHELEECSLSGVYSTWSKYKEWFPSKTKEDYEDLHLQSFVLAKGRRKGWTALIATGIFIKNFTFQESSMNILAAYEKGHYGPMLKSIHTTKTFLDKNTPWVRVTDIKGLREHFIAGINTKNENGVPIQEGYLSEIRAESFKDNPFKGIGDTADVINIEEAGKFNKLLETFPISIEPLIRDGEMRTGWAIIGGTAGDMESGGSIGLYTIMNSPDAYGCKVYQNIYEEVETLTDCGWFIDDLWYSPKKVSKKELLELNDSERTKHILDQFTGTHINLSDHCGNSYRYLSDLILMQKREKLRKSDTVTYQKALTQQPKYLSEAFLLDESSPFDTATAKEALGQLMVMKNIGAEPGTFVKDADGNIQWKKDFSLQPVDTYPFTKDNKAGCWVMYNDRRTETYKIINDANEEEKLEEVRDWRYIAGCLLPGEKVLTNKGLKNIEEVNNSDLLINENGNPVKIIDRLKYNKVNEEVYTINMYNTFRETTFTKEHPILSSKPNNRRNYKVKHPKYKYGELYHNFDFKYKKVHELKNNDWVKLPNIYKREIPIDYTLWNNDEYRIDRQIKNPLLEPDFWWLVGLWLGDGWCDSKGYKVFITINKEETHYINKLESVIKYLFNRKLTKRDRLNGCIECSFSLQQLNSFLTLHFGNYAKGKKLPEWSKYIPHYLKENLILGYLDSDGCIIQNEKYHSMEFVSVNLELLEGFQDILFSIGIVSGITKLRDYSTHIIKEREVNCIPTYHLRIANYYSMHLGIKLLNLSIQDHKLLKFDWTKLSKYSRSTCYFSEDFEYIYLKINKITKSKYTGEVYNFHCETNTFMCHHITTHNCDPIDWGSGESSKDGVSKHSMACTYIIDTVTRSIVAEYIGRPRTSEDYFEQLWRGIEYYNGLLLYENNLKGLFSYFKMKNKLYLLANEPTSLKDVYGYKSTNRIKGFHATPATNNHARELIHRWTLEEIPLKQDEHGEVTFIQRMYTIPSIGLLQEIIRWHSKANFDRISGFGAAMILLFDREYETEETKTKVESTFNKGIFKRVKERTTTNKFKKLHIR